MYTKLFTKQQTNFQSKSSYKKAGAGLKTGLALALSLFLLAFTSCSKNRSPIIIWTNIPEFASYAELFNSTHQIQKALVVYKAEPANSLPPQKNEQVPDIIIGSWLKNSRTRQYFSPVDYLFSEQKINRSLYYPSLIEYGTMNDKQYLIPVNFNLPLMAFMTTNEDLIEDDHLLTLEQIEKSAESFNSKNRYDEYTSMGFAPAWDDDFCYEATKLQGTSYQEKGNNFSWNNDALESTVTLFRNWTTECNGSTTAEDNFKFKYLFVPKYKQITSGRCLFAFMTSDDFFNLNQEQLSSLSFRWLSSKNKIPVEDDLITMGLYRHSKNTKDAEVFIQWFNQEETQTKLLERTAGMELDSTSFGIAGGFSPLKSVNEKVFPVYYRQLLENMPAEEYLSLPSILPYTWPRLKKSVIFPYLKENIDSELTDESNTKSIAERIADWNKQYF